MSLEDRVRIATPEGVRLDLVLAGLGSRFLAAMLDTLVQVVLIIAPTLALAAIAQGSGWTTAFLVTWFFLVIFGYYPIAETLGSGRTIGKRAAGIRVVGVRGGPIGFLSSAVRNLVRIVDFLPFFYGVGITAILVTPRSQRLGDLAAGTYVVRERRSSAPAPSRATPASGATPSSAWAADPASVALDAALAVAGSPPVLDPSRVAHEADRPRVDPPEPWRDWDVSAITPAETELVRRFVLRRSAIAPHARVHLASQLAARLRPKVPAAPAWPDETLLECIVAAKSSRG